MSFCTIEYQNLKIKIEMEMGEKSHEIAQFEILLI